MYPLISCNQICISFHLQNSYNFGLTISYYYWCDLHTNCQGFPYIGIINRIELVSSSARVIFAKFQKGLVCRYLETNRPDPRDTWVR